MKGDAGVIAHLNAYLAFELTGFKQYLLHSRHCADRGYTRLAEIQREYSTEEAVHAGKVMDRILFLEGQPALEDQRLIARADTVPGQIELDLGLVNGAIALLREAVPGCEQASDYVSRDLLREMLDDEERHAHWLEVQLALIASLGLENYLQSRT